LRRARKFTDQQRSVLSRHFDCVSDIPRSSTVRTMWRQQGCDIRDTKTAKTYLEKFLQRLRLRALDTSIRPDGTGSMAELAAYLRQRQGDLDPGFPTRIVVLPDFYLSEDSSVIFIPFTAQGLVAAAAAIGTRHLCIVIDGKWKAVQNRWVIVSIGIMEPTAARVRTTLARIPIPNGRTIRVQSWEHTTHFLPLVLAVGNAESNEVVNRLTQCLLRLLSTIQPTLPPPAERILQFHSDFAAALSQARRLFLRFARFCGDYPHFVRNLMNLRRRAGIGAAHTQAIHLLANLTRFLPTPEAFSILWEHQVEYLSQLRVSQLNSFFGRYFCYISPEELVDIGILRTIDNPHPYHLYHAGWHAGVFTILPATAGGSQCIEAYHAHWQILLNVARRLRTMSECFNVCEQLFQRVLDARQPWRTNAAGENITPDLRLLRPNGLLHTAEPSAYDLWRYRSRGNHLIRQSGVFPSTCYVVFRLPPPLAELHRAEATGVAPGQHVRRQRGARTMMRATPSHRVWSESDARYLPGILRRRWEHSHPAAEAVDPSAAGIYIDLLETSGAPLVELLRRLEILPASARACVSLPALRRHVHSHCAVVVGPRARLPGVAVLTGSAPMLCTCQRFLQRGTCQHVVFVSSISIPGIRDATLFPAFTPLAAIFPREREG